MRCWAQHPSPAKRENAFLLPELWAATTPCTQLLLYQLGHATRQELHQHFPSCQNMETELEGSCKEQSILSREVLLVHVHPVSLDTTQVCKAEQVPHGWHRSPWRDRGQQKCPFAYLEKGHPCDSLSATDQPCLELRNLK